MAITAKDVLHRASLLLSDQENVRWTLPEMRLWLNDGMREIAIHKPNAVTKTVILQLEAGAHQTHDHIALVRVVANANGKTITATRREIMDAVMPGWQAPATLAASATVVHVIQDMMEPTSFYVVPPNDGTGRIEAVVAAYPDDIPAPTNPFSIDSYGMTLDVRPIYRGALVDFVLSRAYAKDEADPNMAQRAVAHYTAFANAIGLKVQGETVARLGTSGDTE